MPYTNYAENFREDTNLSIGFFGLGTVSFYGNHFCYTSWSQNIPQDACQASMMKEAKRKEPYTTRASKLFRFQSLFFCLRKLEEMELSKTKSTIDLAYFTLACEDSYSPSLTGSMHRLVETLLGRLGVAIWKDLH